MHLKPFLTVALLEDVTAFQMSDIIYESNTSQRGLPVFVRTTNKLLHV